MASFQVAVCALAFLVFVQISSRFVHCNDTDETVCYKNSCSPYVSSCVYEPTYKCQPGYGCRGYCNVPYGYCGGYGYDKYSNGYTGCAYGCGQEDCYRKPVYLCIQIVPEKEYSTCESSCGYGYSSSEESIQICKGETDTTCS